MKKYFFNILLFTSLLSLLHSCGKKSETVLPQKKNIVQAVYASGKIYPKNRYKIYARFPGMVKEIKVKIGQTVKKGEVLAVIKSDISDFQLLTAQNINSLAQRNAGDDSPLLEAQRNEINAAKSKYELDSLNAVRYANLLKENATAKINYDQAQTQFEISKRNYLKSLSNYFSSKDRLNTEAKNAAIQVQSSASNKSEYTILSESDGVVYDLDLYLNELVPMSKPVFEVGDPLQFEVELNIDETDITFMRMQQEVLFTCDAFRDSVFKGLVQEIYPRISQGAKTCKVISSFNSTNNLQIFSGMSVEANIIIAKKDSALVIPREFLWENNKVKKKGEESLTEIKKGIEDLEFVEVISGINANDELIKK